jgi:hypothetical protein
MFRFLMEISCSARSVASKEPYQPPLPRCPPPLHREPHLDHEADHRPKSEIVPGVIKRARKVLS